MQTIHQGLAPDSNRALRRGYTLLEMIFAVGASTALLMGMGSLIVFSANAIPSPQDSAARIAHGHAVLQRIADQIQTASEVYVLNDGLELVVYDETEVDKSTSKYMHLDGTLLRVGAMNTSADPVWLEEVEAFAASRTMAAERVRNVRLTLHLAGEDPIAMTVETVLRPLP